MKPRQLILILCLSVVVLLTIWRIANPRHAAVALTVPGEVRPAPIFQLLDQNGRAVSLKGFLGRHRVLLYFFDGRKGANADPVMVRLRELYPAIRKQGLIVVAVSTPPAPEHKADLLSYPFSVLRDTPAGQPGSCTVQWGRTPVMKSPADKVILVPAAFIIDAAGMVAWDGDFPQPESDAETSLNLVLAGKR